MLILTFRTDKPEAELGLFRDQTRLAYLAWPAHRELAETIHQKIKQLVQDNGHQLGDLDGIVTYMGPGSFTGLRIGIGVANALADSLSRPITGSRGDNWIEEGVAELMRGGNQKIVVPEYGAQPNVTQAKK